MNSQTQKNINRLHPAVRAKFIALVSALETEMGEEFFIPDSGSYRTFAEQDALYAQGRTKSGQIVTNATGGHGNHNYGLAADIVPKNPDANGKNGWHRGKTYYTKMGEIGKRLGFVWGGNFKKLYDPTHFQFTFGKSTDDLFSLHKAGRVDSQGYVIIEGVTIPDTPAPVVPAPPVVQINTQTPPKKKNNKAIIIAASFLFLLAVGGVFIIAKKE